MRKKDIKEKTIEWPKVSIMMATYNSEKLLKRTLEAVSQQTYPKDKIEILIVDGGSKDNTLAIAEEYGCRILLNDKTEPVNAKLIGARNATGKYLITIDHDEVIENRESIELKVKALLENPECKVALCSGYKRPVNYPKLNQYISEFGDPFSLFMYNFPKGDTFLERALKKYYIIDKENTEYMVITFENMKKQPIFELCCLGTMIDREYFIKIPEAFECGSKMVHLFYIMLEQGEKSVVLVKNDALVHYSVDSLKAYLPKLKWRICNNIHFDEMGESGFSGRIQYQKGLKYKKLLFVPYTVSCILPLIHSIYLALSRRNSIYLMHAYLCWYVLVQILYQYGLKIIGKNPNLMSYDGKKVIK